MKTWTKGYINANGIQVHYYRSGGNKPQVVLNHGAMDDGLCWTQVAKELEHDYDVIMFDARGHGLTDSGRGDYRSETRADDLAKAIEILGLEKPVIGGHSMGADVSIHLAASYPEIPRAIFLEDPPVTMPGESMFGGEMGKNGERVLKLMTILINLFRILPKFMGTDGVWTAFPIADALAFVLATYMIRKEYNHQCRNHISEEPKEAKEFEQPPLG